AWTAAVLAVPARAARGEAPALRAAVYAAGALACHQRPERSFHAHGVPLPVCARCTGLYLAGVLGALLGWVGTPVVPRRTRTLVVVAAVPTVVTVVLERAGIAAPSNVVRATAAVPVGAAAGWLFVRLLRDEGVRSTCAMISS